MTPEQLLQESDLCVKCGLCLPYCPTYRIAQDEGDSPRGRIALMQAVASGQLEGTPQLHAHLNRCVGCRACERVCPSAVKYGKLIDGIRAISHQQGGSTGRWVKKTALKLASRPLLLSLGAAVVQRLPRRHLQKLGGQNLKRIIGFSLDVSHPIKWRATYPPTHKRVGQVGLFLGCISRFSDQAALLSAIQVLNHLGWEVVIPPKQTCCGALHQHAGNPATAQKLKAENQAAFGDQPLEAILTIASGCGTHIKEYANLSTPTRDISDFLNQQPWPEQVTLKPLSQPVVVHDACSLRTAGSVYQLLNRIPEIELISLAENTFCCGAGGINLVTEPQMADALLVPKLESLQASKATILLTSNTSCALHFVAGIRKAGLNVEVLHPVQLLERQLLDNDNSIG